jgi:TrmH family RNA methyltransferase
VLVRTRNPLNIGAVARAMSNFGFSCLRVVQPYEASFREARSAVGASEILARAEQYDSVADAVGDCTLVVGTTSFGKRESPQPVERLETGAALIRRQLAVGQVALLFGSEKTGLRNEDLSHCHWLMRIPTREEHGSMNLGQAVAVCLYELARDGHDLRRPLGRAPSQSKNARNYTALHKDQAASAEVERLTSVLVEALDASGFLKARSAASEQKVRQLLRRLSLAAEDAEILLGMVRQMLWKMEAAGSAGSSKQ